MAEGAVMNARQNTQSKQAAPRSLDVLLGNPRVANTVHWKVERSGIQTVHTDQSCLNLTHLPAGRDHHIAFDLEHTEHVLWQKSGRKEYSGVSPASSVTIIPAHESSDWRFTRTNKLHVFVPDDLLRSRINALGLDARKATIPDVLARADPAFSHLLKAVYHEARRHGGVSLLQQTLHEAVCSMLITHYVDGFPKEAIDRSLTLERAVIRDGRIARAIDYAEVHIGEALTVAELAAVACLSAGHFSRAFKATTGEAVWAYVQRRRGERALEMLQHTELPIAEIAYACGFASQAHFTRRFKRQFGVTPAQVRREAQL